MNFNIFFSGGAGAGKTYCAKYLIDNYNYLTGKLALPIYACAKQYFGMDGNNKDRPLLQKIGDIGRSEISENIFINRLEQDMYMVQRTYEDLYNKKIFFVLDDVRFKNEYEILTELGFIGIYLDVDPLVRKQRLKNRDGDSQDNSLTHKSEQDIEKFKNNLYKIDASGTLEQTYNKLEELFEHIKKEKRYEYKS